MYWLTSKNLNKMKKILLTILYPFWFGFAKTWFGNVMMIPISLAPIPILIHLIFHDHMIIAGGGAEGIRISIGIGVGILALLCSPFTGMLFMAIDDKLETNYEKWNYKTNINSKYK